MKTRFRGNALIGLCYVAPLSLLIWAVVGYGIWYWFHSA